MKYDPGTGIEYYTAGEAQNISLRITPNPFTMQTRISVGTAQRAEGTELRIYDVTGRHVKSFPLSTAYSLLPTPAVWDGTDHTGRKLPSGAYVCTVKYGKDIFTEKVLLIR